MDGCIFPPKLTRILAKKTPQDRLGSKNPFDAVAWEAELFHKMPIDSGLGGFRLNKGIKDMLVPYTWNSGTHDPRRRDLRSFSSF